MSIQKGKLYSYETEDGLNMAIVDDIANGTVYLDNGAQIPLSQFASTANIVMDGYDNEEFSGGGFEIKVDKNGYPILPTAMDMKVKEEMPIAVVTAQNIKESIATTTVTQNAMTDDQKAVMTLLQKSKKDNMEVNMVIPMMLPPKAFMNMISESFDDDMSDTIIDGILDTIDKEEIIKALKGCLKKIYEM